MQKTELKETSTLILALLEHLSHLTSESTYNEYFNRRKQAKHLKYPFYGVWWLAQINSQSSIWSVT